MSSKAPTGPGRLLPAKTAFHAAPLAPLGDKATKPKQLPALKEDGSAARLKSLPALRTAENSDGSTIGPVTAPPEQSEKLAEMSNDMPGGIASPAAKSNPSQETAKQDPEPARSQSATKVLEPETAGHSAPERHQSAPSAQQHDLSTPAEVKPHEELLVLTITWNMANKAPPDTLTKLLGWNGSSGDTEVGNYDVIAIGVQEAHDLDKWDKSLAAGVAQSTRGRFVYLESERLDPGGWIHLAVFVKQKLLPFCSGVHKGSISTGIGNVIGNKGGVAVAFAFENTTFLFINAHFAAHSNNIEARNNDFKRISCELFEDKASSSKSASDSGANESAPDKTEDYDAVVWMGDLNYRVEANRKAVDTLIEDGMLEVLLANDQLGREKGKGKVFQNYNEGKLTFPPTYKFDKWTDVYDSSSKQRVPSWTDRILYKCPKRKKGKKKIDIKLLEYGCISVIKTSDHRPVAAKLQCKMLGKYEGPPLPLYQAGPTTSRACFIQ